MKKWGLLFLLVVLAFSVSAPGGKKKAGKKVARKSKSGIEQVRKGEAEVGFQGFRFESGEMVEISAERMNLLLNERRATFFDQVIVKKGGSVIYCDKLELKYKEQGEIEWLKAEGAVKLMEKESFATANELEYFQNQDRFWLRGAPKLVSKGQIVLGKEMVFDLGKNRLKVIEPEIQFERETQ